MKGRSGEEGYLYLAFLPGQAKLDPQSLKLEDVSIVPTEGVWRHSSCPSSFPILLHCVTAEMAPIKVIANNNCVSMEASAHSRDFLAVASTHVKLSHVCLPRLHGICKLPEASGVIVWHF